MCVIELRITANHAEYGPIVAYMGPLLAEMELKSGPISTPGATTGHDTAPAPIVSPTRLQGTIFMRPEGTNGWRCS